jgi:quercetin dioxygenase-like cupin family protein
MADTLQPLVVPPGAAPSIRAFGEEIIVHLSGAQTDGAFTLFTAVTPPGGGPPPHYHQYEDETFVVMEGRFAFYCNKQWTEVPVGTTVFMPKTVVHAFKNVGDTTGRVLISTRPSGFEVFFARCAEVFQRSGAPDMPRIIEISAEHGIHFVEG